MPFSFPGGIEDDNDDDIVGTALRETHEEIGLSKDSIQTWVELQTVPDRVGCSYISLRSNGITMLIVFMISSKEAQMPLVVSSKSDQWFQRSRKQNVYR